MFEKYDINNLFKATIVDHGSIISMETIGGCIGFSSVSAPISYETILNISGDEILDINNPNRVINQEIKVPTMNMPRTSNDGHLYTVVEESLVKYRDTITKDDAKSLTRTPFGNKLK